MPQVSTKGRVYEDADGDRWEEQPDGTFKWALAPGGDPLSLVDLTRFYGPLELVSPEPTFSISELRAAESDMVNHPAHYISKNGMEAIDVIEAFELGHHDGAAAAYILRWRNKNGIEDLRKAVWYLNRLIANEEQRAAAG
jgi:hypothetical protein